MDIKLEFYDGETKYVKNIESFNKKLFNMINANLDLPIVLFYNKQAKIITLL